MEMSELTAYAKEKYRLEEEYKWVDFPGFSVICHPQTGKWIALLMRQWDENSGTVIQRCDLKCGQPDRRAVGKPYLSAPLRMKGDKWTGVAFTSDTEREVVFRLFDRAMTAAEPRGLIDKLLRRLERNEDSLPTGGATIVLEPQSVPVRSACKDTPLPFSGSSYRPERQALPERLRQMRRLYEYGGGSAKANSRSFYRQAAFMADYEDDFPWSGDFFCYYPTYHELTTAQLRGYFTWRSRVRRGEYERIPTSAAYIYVYELLNGIGVAGPEEALHKLREFETGYLDSGIGDEHMRSNLRRWMLELAVISGLPPETAQQYADPQLLQRDAALTVLRAPEDRTDEEVFSALCSLGGQKPARSPVVTGNPERGRHLFSEVWRCAASNYRDHGKNLFTLCFGVRSSRRWFPLDNAIYYLKEKPADRTCDLTECRSYRCRDGDWTERTYHKTDKDRWQGFLHETDLLLRRYLKTGRYLKEKEEEQWAAPFINQVIEADRQDALAAARPKINIDLTGLEQIRRDALTTQNSLLTEEDRLQSAAEEAPSAVCEPALPAELPDIPLDPVQQQILRTLLTGGSPEELLRSHHLMPSLVADAVNEALFDEIGDTVLDCDGDVLSLVEDYKEELAQLLGGA